MSNQQTKFNKALQLHHSGMPQEAILIYRDILKIDKNNPYLLFLLGSALSQTGNSKEGIRYLQKSLDLSPNPITYNNIGTTYAKINKNNEAIDSFNKAIALVPSYAEAYSNRGAALRNLGQLEESLASCNYAILLEPNYADAYNNKGNALFDLERYRDALDSYEKAIQLLPNYAEAYRHRGDTLKKLERIEEAFESYNRAIALKPDYPEAYSNRGNVLHRLKRLDEALADYKTAFKFKSDMKFLLGTMLHTKMQLCDWKGFEDNLDLLESKVHNSIAVSQPFEMQGLLDSSALQRKCAEIYIAIKFPLRNISSLQVPHNNQQKIKIGYFSSDFGNHPVTHLLAGLFKEHDRTKFEVFAFSLEERELDEWRNRVIKGVDRFADVTNKTDAEIAALSRSLEIDIAIDLNGHTKHARTGIFAHRAAPIQASYIGFLGTMGASYFDYLIADPILIPEGFRDFYTEKIAYLPSYQCNDNKIEVSEKVFTRSEFGLPDDAFVFCSFNNNWKITPSVFDSWMKILGKAPTSVLWIYVDNATAQANLLEEAKKRGIDPSRLVFASKIPLVEHLARQRLADLFLDTFPYNAGATASNALRVGLPVITRSGKSFASRYGASLLTSIGLPELITESTEQFESLAIQLATNPNQIAAIKAKLAGNLSTHPLFDTVQFTRNIERTYAAMYERSKNDLPPDHILYQI